MKITEARELALDIARHVQHGNVEGEKRARQDLAFFKISREVSKAIEGGITLTRDQIISLEDSVGSLEESNSKKVEIKTHKDPERHLILVEAVLNPYSYASIEDPENLYDLSQMMSSDLLEMAIDSSTLADIKCAISYLEEEIFRMDEERSEFSDAIRILKGKVRL